MGRPSGRRRALALVVLALSRLAFPMLMYTCLATWDQSVQVVEVMILVLPTVVALGRMCWVLCGGRRKRRSLEGHGLASESEPGTAGRQHTRAMKHRGEATDGTSKTSTDLVSPEGQPDQAEASDNVTERCSASRMVSHGCHAPHCCAHGNIKRLSRLILLKFSATLVPVALFVLLFSIENVLIFGTDALSVVVGEAICTPVLAICYSLRHKAAQGPVQIVSLFFLGVGWTMTSLCYFEDVAGLLRWGLLFCVSVMRVVSPFCMESMISWLHRQDVRITSEELEFLVLALSLLILAVMSLCISYSGWEWFFATLAEDSGLGFLICFTAIVFTLRLGLDTYLSSEDGGTVSAGQLAGGVHSVADKPVTSPVTSLAASPVAAPTASPVPSTSPMGPASLRTPQLDAHGPALGVAFLSTGTDPQVLQDKHLSDAASLCAFVAFYYAACARYSNPGLQTDLRLLRGPLVAGAQRPTPVHPRHTTHSVRYAARFLSPTPSAEDQSDLASKFTVGVIIVCVSDFIYGLAMARKSLPLSLAHCMRKRRRRERPDPNRASSRAPRTSRIARESRDAHARRPNGLERHRNAPPPQPVAMHQPGSHFAQFVPVRTAGQPNPSPMPPQSHGRSPGRSSGPSPASGISAMWVEPHTVSMGENGVDGHIGMNATGRFSGDTTL